MLVNFPRLFIEMVETVKEHVESTGRKSTTMYFMPWNLHLLTDSYSSTSTYRIRIMIFSDHELNMFKKARVYKCLTQSKSWARAPREAGGAPQPSK